MYYTASAFMHENYKASKSCSEEATKDASSIIYVGANEL